MRSNEAYRECIASLVQAACEGDHDIHLTGLHRKHVSGFDGDGRSSGVSIVDSPPCR